MINRNIIRYSIFIVVLFFSKISFAQNTEDALRLSFQGLGSNARALGMGNSYIGVSDDYSAMFYNPAGLGLLKRMEFATGLNYYNYDNKATYLGKTTDFSNSETRLNNFSFAFPFPTLRGSLVFGLSYNVDNDFTSAEKFSAFNPGTSSIINDYLTSKDAGTRKVPFDLYLADFDSLTGNYTTPLNGNLQQSGTVLTSGRTSRWGFSGAVEVERNVFVGATLNILSGNYSFNRDYYEDDTHHIYSNVELANGLPETRNFQTFHQNRRLDWDLSGWDAKIGVLYQLEHQARFGFTVQFPKSYTVKENFNLTETSIFANDFPHDPTFYSDEVQYDITTPYVLSAGASYSFKGLVLSVGGSLTDYSQMKFSNPDNLDVSILDDANTTIRDSLKAVFDYNLGLEYNIPGVDVRVRGGYFIQASPYRSDPSSYDRHYLTGGLGILSSRSLAFDIAYVYGWWDTYGYNYATAVERTNQSIKSNNLIFTASYRF